MVAYCSVFGCKSSSKDNKDIKFHRFPRDERRQLWIEACQRPELKDKTVEQLYNMYVCSLHFEKWMYLNTKLKSAAIPVSNLPSAAQYPMSTQTCPMSTQTQTQTPKIEIIKDLTNRGVQQQTDIASAGVFLVASTSSQASQTTEKNTDPTSRKTKLQGEFTSCAEKLMLMEDAKSTDVTYEQFLQGCDKFLSPNLSRFVKAQANLNPDK